MYAMITSVLDKILLFETEVIRICLNLITSSKIRTHIKIDCGLTLWKIYADFGTLLYNTRK